MPVWRRYKGKRLEETDPNWSKGTWVAEGRVKGKFYKKAMRFVRDRSEAEAFDLQLQTQIALEFEVARTPSQILQRHRARTTSGWNYVYIIQCDGFYKIGYAKNVPSRLSQLERTLGPREAFFVIAVRSANAVALECRLHATFEHRRVRGEWFLLNNSEVQEAKQIMVANSHSYAN